MIPSALPADGGIDSSDEQALARMRAGDDDAYVLLYERHVGSARRLARSILRDANDVDDVVADVFAASFAAIRRGRGPHDAFGPYVLSSVRRECYRTWRRRKKRNEAPVERADIERAEVADYRDPAEKAVLEAAFAGLPENMRTVLWMSEVEGLSHGAIAMRMASTTPAVAALAMRSRRSLAERYLAAHAGDGAAPAGEECRWARHALAGLVRGTASARQRRRVDDHLAQCSECASARDHLRLVNRRLRGLTPPALVGTIGWSHLLGFGLRARLGAWLLGPGAATIAVTGALTAAIVLPSASDGAEPVVAAQAAEERSTATTSAGPTTPTPRPVEADDESAQPVEVPSEPTARTATEQPLDAPAIMGPQLAPWTWPVVVTVSAPAPALAPPAGGPTAEEPPVDVGIPQATLPDSQPPIDPDIPSPGAVSVPSVEAPIDVTIPELPLQPELPATLPSIGGLPSAIDDLDVPVEPGSVGAPVPAITTPALTAPLVTAAQVTATVPPILDGVLGGG